MNAAEVVVATPETGAEAPVVSTRPEHVPAEFWDEESKSIKTDALLEAVKGNTAATEETTEETPEETPEGDEEAEALAAEAGIDVADVEAAFLESGTIPEDTYEKAAKIGVSKEMVDEFVQYRVRQADMLRDEILQPFGGMEIVTKMVEWAGSAWKPEQAEAFNGLVNSGDRAKIELAVRGLQADYQKAHGVRPKLVTPAGGANTPAGGVFRSIQELAAAQADPRYKTDPAYRDAVIAKLSRSKI